MKFDFVTVVWGKNHIHLFLEVAIRSLLAPGNIPTIATRHDIHYTIYTSKDEADFLREQPVIQELEKLVNLEFDTFEDGHIDRSRYSDHWKLWHEAFERTKSRRRTLFLIIPDIIFVNGALDRWASLLEQGFHTIFAPALQVLSESIIPELRRIAGDFIQPIVVSAAEGRDLMARHLHPLNCCLLRGAPRHIFHSEFALFPSGYEGFVMRVLTSHPLVLTPSACEYTSSLCPLGRLDQVAFDECMTLSVEKLAKYARWYHIPWQMGDDELSNFGGWLNFFVSRLNELEVRHVYHFPKSHMGDAVLWHRAELSSVFHVLQLEIIRRIYRVWTKLHEVECGEAAKVLALAHYQGRLRRRWNKGRGPFTVLVPCNDALNAPGDTLLDGMGVRGFRGVTEFVQQHVFPRTETFAAGQYLTLENGNLRLDGSGSGIKILAGPVQVEDLTLYVIDRLIGPIPESQGATQTLQPMVRPHRSIARFQRVLARRPWRAFVDFVCGRGMAAAHDGSPPSEDALDHLCRAQAMTVLLNAQEILADYGRRQGIPGERHAALCMVSEMIARNGISRDMVRKHLKEARTLSPAFGEVHYELGILAMAENDYEKACASFAEAAKYPARIKVEEGEISLAGKAFYGAAFARTCQGRDDDAYTLYQQSLESDSVPFAHLCVARMMLARNKMRDSLPHFNEAMHFRWILAPLLDIDEHIAGMEKYNETK